MKRWLTHSLVVLAVLIASCDFGPINSAVDDFNIVVELEDINTGFSIGVFDSETKEIIEQEVTIRFDSVTALNTIDIFSDPVESDNFSGGFFSAGINNAVVPTQDNPFTVTLTLSTDGYLDMTTSVILSETGGANFNLDMISENNLPDSYAIDILDAPLDSEGNALPFPNPIDTTTGELIDPSLLAKAFNTNKSLILPKITIPNDKRLEDLTWVLVDGTVFKGLPVSYEVGTFTWNPRTPEFNIGYTYEEVNYRYRIISEIFSLKIKGPNSTNYSPVHSIKFDDGINELSSMKFEFLLFTPDRENYWHESVRKNVTSYAHYDLLTSQANSRPILLPTHEDSTETTVKYFPNWLSKTTYTHDRTESNLFGTYIREPYFLIPGPLDPIGKIFFIFEQTVTSADIPAMASIQRNGPSPLGTSTAVYARIRSIDNLNIHVSGYGENDISSITVRTDGYNYSGIENTPTDTLSADYLIKSVPMSPAIITVELPQTSYSVYYDLSDYAGETIELTPPSKPTNLINSTITANVECTDPDQYELNISGFPIHNISVRYRKVGDTNSYPRVASVKGTNYDQSKQVLTGAVINFPGVEIGEEYEFILSIDAFSEKTTQVITSEDFSIDLKVRNSFCQSK